MMREAVCLFLHLFLVPEAVNNRSIEDARLGGSTIGTIDKRSLTTRLTTRRGLGWVGLVEGPLWRVGYEEW